MERLNKLKASRMKELVMKKRSELEDICHKTHIEPDPSTAPEKSTALIDSGLHLIHLNSNRNLPAFITFIFCLRSNRFGKFSVS